MLSEANLVGWNVLAEGVRQVRGESTSQVDGAEVCIVGSAEPAVAEAIAATGPERLVLDLVRLPNAEARRAEDHYIGIGW